jgi:hypothetical protein
MTVITTTGVASIMRYPIEKTPHAPAVAQQQWPATVASTG